MSLRSRSPELKTAQGAIMKVAKNLADRRIRDELLADTGEFSLVRRLSMQTNQTVPSLRGGWKPYYIDKEATSGFGFKLKVDDKLVLEILKDMGLLDRVNEIAVKAVIDSMMNERKLFVESLLNDLVSSDSFYEATGR